MLRKRTVRGLPFALALGLGSVIAAPVAAEAATGNCAGTRIEHIQLDREVTSGHYVPAPAYLDVYWDAKTKTNCARTVATGAASGVAKYMSVHLTACDLAVDSNPCQPYFRQDADADNHGKFKYYAGPVKVTAGKTCISAKGEMDWKGTRYSAGFSRLHCS
jgi:hypothetical protein